MHICFTLSSLSSGGAERVAVSLCNSFCEKKHKVTIILVSVDYNNTFFELDSRIDVIPLLGIKKAKNPLKRTILLRKTIKKINPDIVISFLPHVIIYTFYALKHLKIPFICSERNDPNRYSIFYKFLLKKAFKKANGCVYQTLDALSFYEGKKQKNNSVIIANPVFLNISDSVSKSDQNSKNFISVGRLVPQKNFSLLISSFADFHIQFPEYRLLIFGDGPLKKTLQDLINNKMLTNSVFLCGQNKMWHDIALSSAGFISSSDYEGMPNCLEEALCLGCPSLATDCPIGGSRDLINELGNGILVPVGDQNALSKGMAQLISGKFRHKNIDYNSFSVDTISKKWISFLEQIYQNPLE